MEEPSARVRDFPVAHGCLEGPEAGVYYRGKAELPTSRQCRVELPSYVPHFVRDCTVHLTAIGPEPRILTASEVTEGAFTVYGAPGPFHWIVHGLRGTVEVEPVKADVCVEGTGPYRYIVPQK